MPIPVVQALTVTDGEIRNLAQDRKIHDLRVLLCIKDNSAAVAEYRAQVISTVKSALHPTVKDCHPDKVVGLMRAKTIADYCFLDAYRKLVECAYQNLQVAKSVYEECCGELITSRRCQHGPPTMTQQFRWWTGGAAHTVAGACFANTRPASSFVHSNLYTNPRYVPSEPPPSASSAQARWDEGDPWGSDSLPNPPPTKYNIFRPTSGKTDEQMLARTRASIPVLASVPAQKKTEAATFTWTVCKEGLEVTAVRWEGQVTESSRQASAPKCCCIACCGGVGAGCGVSAHFAIFLPHPCCGSSPPGGADCGRGRA